MIKYTKEYIAKLLDKYMDGTSTNGRTIGNSLAR